MSNTSTGREIELREQILEAGKVTAGSVTWKQKVTHVGNMILADPIKVQNQDIVEIGIDDLMSLVASHTNAARIGAKIDAYQDVLDFMRTATTDPRDIEVMIRQNIRTLKDHINRIQKELADE